MRGNFPLARPGQNSRAFDIAQDDGDFRRNFSRGAGNGHRDKVRAFAGTEHTDAEFIAHGDLNNRVPTQNKWKGGSVSSSARRQHAGAGLLLFQAVA
jgi:Ni/Co efflux regulator RcnB